MWQGRRAAIFLAGVTGWLDITGWGG